MKKKWSCAEAINKSSEICLERDESVRLFGLGVNDPKGVFGTTSGLVRKFGKTRVFEPPTSENAFTGAAIGMSLTGLRPIMVHQRLDFFLLALDQIVNAAAKWSYMFDRNQGLPMLIRLIVGRGWGQGPTHSQSLHSWFAHIPGLVVVAPSSSQSAFELYTQALGLNTPVISIEHRWLHNSTSNFDVLESLDNPKYKIGSSVVVREGRDITIVASSFSVVEALGVARELQAHQISTEIIDVSTLSPLNWEVIVRSTEKTGRVLVLDQGSRTCGYAAEIMAGLYERVKVPFVMRRLTMPDIPVPTSHELSKFVYPSLRSQVEAAAELIGIKIDVRSLSSFSDDVPDHNFMGPF